MSDNEDDLEEDDSTETILTLMAGSDSNNDTEQEEIKVYFSNIKLVCKNTIKRNLNLFQLFL